MGFAAAQPILREIVDALGYWATRFFSRVVTVNYGVTPYAVSSRPRWRREEAASGAVGPLAAPVGTVGGWLGFLEGNDLAVDHVIARAAHLYVFRRDHGAIAETATPFARNISKAAG
jgi:hypothetical protein